MDKAIEGFRSANPDAQVKKINLIDCKINHCLNCLACRDSKTDQPYAQCSIKDDMDWISQDLFESDRILVGTPVHFSYVTGLVMVFLERMVWRFSKPEKSYLTLKGCPMPRLEKPRRVGIIVVSGAVPPALRIFCDEATGQIKSVMRDSLSGKTVADFYAGAIEQRGVEAYFDRAYRLGETLALAP